MSERPVGNRPETPVRGYGTPTPRADATPALSLHIDRLVLSGLSLPPAAAPRLQAALDSELTRLLAGASLRNEFGGGTALAELALPALQLAPGATPGRVGRQLARALARALTVRRGHASGDEQ